VRRANNLNHFHVPIVLKSGSLKLLEPSGPLQACYGIALPLYIYIERERERERKKVSVTRNSKTKYVNNEQSICPGLVHCSIAIRLVETFS